MRSISSEIEGADRPRTTSLSGWGANLPADCVLAEPENEGQIVASIDRAGTIARGLGRSYGDAALNGGGQVVGMTRFDRYLGFDEATGTLTCESGVSLEHIIRDFAPRGWFPMITPGTKFVTVGGYIANDVHGNAHHAQGLFSVCVDAMTVLLASGEIVEASRHQHQDSSSNCARDAWLLTSTNGMLDTAAFRATACLWDIFGQTRFLPLASRFSVQAQYVRLCD